ncbi:MAG: hypothetical protein AB1635_12555 [Acidobacteriota bacterium]
MSFVIVVLIFAASLSTAASQPPALDELLARATAYVSDYEQRFSLLVADEHYVQEIRRPDAVGGNLSRANPGGGFQAGGVVRRQVLRSDYLLVRLPDGGGWMPFRDVYEVNGSKVRDREDRLVKLFLEPTPTTFDRATRIMEASTRHNIGSVSRSINIPTLALLFLHADIRGRFAFTRSGEEAMAGRTSTVVEYRETARPTLIKTSRGRDLAMTGRLWIDPATGIVLKTFLHAADPIVRATVTATFRPDTELDLWVPESMEEFYKAERDFNEIYGTATYGTYRRFQVTTDQRFGEKKPGGP